MTLGALLLALLLAAPAAAAPLQVTRRADAHGCSGVFADGGHAFAATDAAWVDLQARAWQLGWPVRYEAAGSDLRAEERFRLGDGAVRVVVVLSPSAGRFRARLLAEPAGDFAVALRQYLPGVSLPCEVRGSLSTAPRQPTAHEPSADDAVAVYHLEHRATELLYDDAFGAADEALARAQVRAPSSDEVRWMRARAAYLEGESLPAADESGRLAAFSRAEYFADQAVALAPEHGEGWLWRAIARGRIVTTQATARTAFDALVGHRGPGWVAKCFERAITLGTTYRHFGYTARGDAMNGAAQLYRMLPKGHIVHALLGVQRDLDRSVKLALAAWHLQPVRLEYAKEAGVSLLCRGVEQGRPEDLRHGRRVLEQALQLPVRTDTERIDHRHVEQLLAGPPDRACGYSRDAWDEGRELREASVR